MLGHETFEAVDVRLKLAGLLRKIRNLQLRTRSQILAQLSAQSGTTIRLVSSYMFRRPNRKQGLGGVRQVFEGSCVDVLRASSTHVEQVPLKYTGSTRVAEN